MNPEMQWDALSRRSVLSKLVAGRLEDWQRFRQSSRRRQVMLAGVGASVACLVAAVSVTAWQHADAIVPGLGPNVSSIDSPAATGADGERGDGDGGVAAGLPPASDGDIPLSGGAEATSTAARPSNSQPGSPARAEASPPAQQRSTPTPQPACNAIACVEVTSTAVPPTPAAPPIAPTLPAAPTVLPSVVSPLSTAPAPSLPTAPVPTLAAPIMPVPTVALPAVPAPVPTSASLCPPVCT